MNDYIIATAWKGGARRGNRDWKRFTYGIRIRKPDRDTLFSRTWSYVELIFEDKYRIRVEITDSFWRKCSELRHEFFKHYFREKGYIPWPRRNPPKFMLIHVEGNVFKLYPLD